MIKNVVATTCYRPMRIGKCILNGDYHLVERVWKEFVAYPAQWGKSQLCKVWLSSTIVAYFYVGCPNCLFQGKPDSQKPVNVAHRHGVKW